MIRAVGIDVVETSRIIEAMESNERFASRILTPRELERKVTPSYLAGRWAAKEAVAKAVGTHLTWQDLEILEGEGGRPTVSFLEHRPEGKVHVSISHDNTLASAVAIWEE
ncbi:MAG: holo-ACP synthase [Fimbriimonadales bacterium]